MPFCTNLILIAWAGSFHILQKALAAWHDELGKVHVAV